MGGDPKRMSRAELKVHRQKQQVTFEERLRKERLKALRQEEEVQGDRTDRAAADAESAAEEARRQEARAYDLRLSLERQQTLMGMRTRRLEAEEANRMGDLAIWRCNLEIRKENAANELARRKEGRARLHEEEMQRLEPFIRMQRAAKDGVINSATPGMPTLNLTLTLTLLAQIRALTLTPTLTLV